MTTVSISFNGKALSVNSETTLAGLIDSHVSDAQFAAAKNGEFIPKSQYATTLLSNGDTIDVVSPVGGG